MEYTSDRLSRMSKSLSDTHLYADYIERVMYQDYKDEFLESERMRNCLSFWDWDLYKTNDLMDLQRVSRCKSRWCPNCRRVTLAQNIMEYAPFHADMISRGYKPYLMTLTQPNVPGNLLSVELKKMNDSFKRFWRWVHGEIGVTGYRSRYFNVMAGVRFLEITRNAMNDTYHPHYHLLVFLDGQENSLRFSKCYEGEYSAKRGSVNFLSDADLQIRELWTKAYNLVRITKALDIEPYMCDIRECDPKGIYEVFKYCFKDSDVSDYQVFEVLYTALKGRRIKQCYGELYGLKLSDEGEENEKADSLVNYLLKEKEETPVKLYTDLKILSKPLYQHCKKISRFAVSQYLEDLGDD